MYIFILIGELWVTYKVKLHSALIYENVLGTGLKQDSFTFGTTAGAIVNNVVAKSDNSLGGTLHNTGGVASTLNYSFSKTAPYSTYRITFKVQTFGINGIMRVDATNSTNVQWCIPMTTLFGNSTSNGVGFWSSAGTAGPNPNVTTLDVLVTGPNANIAFLAVICQIDNNLSGQLFTIVPINSVPDLTLT